MKIAGICGSLRRGSFNRMLLLEAGRLLPDGVSMDVLEIRDLPLYDQDVEAAGEPGSVKAFKAGLAGADALLFATPEYNYSLPGVLKNAIDWASRPPATSPLNGKPAAVIGASGGTGGTIRAQHHLRQVAVFTNTLFLNKPEVLVAKAQDKFEANGALKDEATRAHLRKLVAALVTWTNLVGGKS